MTDYTVIHYGYVLTEKETTIQAESLDAAIEQAETLDVRTPGFYPVELPTIAGWHTSFPDWPDGGFRIESEDPSEAIYDSQG